MVSTRRQQGLEIKAPEFYGRGASAEAAQLAPKRDREAPKRKRPAKTTSAELSSAKRRRNEAASDAAPADAMPSEVPPAETAPSEALPTETATERAVLNKPASQADTTLVTLENWKEKLPQDLDTDVAVEQDSNPLASTSKPAIPSDDAVRPTSGVVEESVENSTEAEFKATSPGSEEVKHLSRIHIPPLLRDWAKPSISAHGPQETNLTPPPALDDTSSLPDLTMPFPPAATLRGLPSPDEDDPSDDLFGGLETARSDAQTPIYQLPTVDHSTESSRHESTEHRSLDNSAFLGAYTAGRVAGSSTNVNQEEKTNVPAVEESTSERVDKLLERIFNSVAQGKSLPATGPSTSCTDSKASDQLSQVNPAAEAMSGLPADKAPQPSQGLQVQHQPPSQGKAWNYDLEPSRDDPRAFYRFHARPHEDIVVDSYLIYCDDAARAARHACGELGLSFNITDRAQTIAHIVIKHKDQYKLANDSPVHIAAGCVYMTSHAMNAARSASDIGATLGLGEDEVVSAYAAIIPKVSTLRYVLESKGAHMSKLPRLPDGVPAAAASMDSELRSSGAAGLAPPYDPERSDLSCTLPNES